MATRFYFPIEGSGAPAVSPAFDGGWEQTGQATRLKLQNKATLSSKSVLANTGTRTVPITTTQDILCNQFVSDPISAQLIDITCLFSLVIRVLESATTANVTLAVVAKVVSNDGGTVRGTLFSSFSLDTEFPTTAATRIAAQTAVTSVSCQSADRIVIEIGGHAAAPTAATTYTMRQGTSAATDFALTTALTTDLNPWCEFSNNITFGTSLNNFSGSYVTGAGISTTGRIK